MKRDITVASSSAEVIAALAEEEKAKVGGDQPAPSPPDARHSPVAAIDLIAQIVAIIFT
jgi:hypothetical protein